MAGEPDWNRPVGSIQQKRRFVMKRIAIAKTFTVAAVTTLALGIAPTVKAADKGCSNATLAGTFAYTSTGFITAPAELAGPVAEIGTQTFDGKGATNATATLSQNGNIAPVTITGTYKVNPDCSGKMTLTVTIPGFMPFPLDVSFVIDDGGNGFQGMEVDSGLVVTRIARRQFPVGDWRQ
jgi:hypothetical protein